MHVFELEKPGIWLVAHDPVVSRRVAAVVSHIEDIFFQANLALNLFEEECAANSPPSQEEWLRAMVRRSEIQEQQKRSGECIDDFQASLRADVIAKRERWQRGVEPQQLTRRRPFLYAEAFLFALDMFRKLLKVLIQEASSLVALEDLNTEFKRIFPHVRELRNTVAHMEDRARGLDAGRNPKVMELAPVENSAISFPSGGVLVLGVLNGSRFGATMATGIYGEVDVSQASMQALRQLVHAIYDRFTWRGPIEHLPHI